MKTSIITLMALSFFLCLPSHCLAVKTDIDLKLQNGLFSANLDRVPLKEIIKRLEAKKGIRFEGSDSLFEEKITVRFTNLSLENGLKRILSSMNYSLIFNRENQLQGVFIIAKNGHRLSVQKEKNVSNKMSGSSPGKNEKTKGPFNVIKNIPPPGSQTKTGSKEIEGFKVIKNISPPGGPVKPSQEQLDNFKVTKDCPPPGGPVKASDKKTLENFKVIKNTPPPGS